MLTLERKVERKGRCGKPKVEPLIYPDPYLWVKSVVYHAFMPHLAQSVISLSLRLFLHLRLTS
jgi:hypothetical protein